MIIRILQSKLFFAISRTLSKLQSSRDLVCKELFHFYRKGGKFIYLRRLIAEVSGASVWRYIILFL